MRKRSLGIKNYLILKMKGSGVKYWEARVRIIGKRAVLDISHTENELEVLTQHQKQILFPLLREKLRGDEKNVLDFGCGYGRFTEDLANIIGGNAVGIDPVESLIRIAGKKENVEYLVMEEGKIPLPDKSVDIVWICLVIGGITKKKILRKTVDEINRVLVKEGLLFLVENTTESKNSKHWRFLRYGDYRELFPFISLEHLSEYYDSSERISIMAGRKYA